MSQRDYYEILEIPRDATADQIKKAYRAHARKFHPDVNPGDKTAEAKFKETQSAYDVLSNPDMRKRYDMFGHAGMQGGGAGPRESSNQWSASQAGPGFENIDFRQFFGGGAEAPEAGGGMFDDLLGRFGGGRSRRAGPRRGADLEASLSIPFNTAILGGPTTIEFSREDGSHQSLEVRIPPGTENGAKLRLKGRGAPGEPNAPPGDLTITVAVLPHAFFRREGKDMLIDLPISIDEAVLGAKVDVPTLTGSTVSLTIPSGTSSGQKLRVRGKGVPAHGDRTEGDMFVITKVVAPRQVDEESRRLIQAFAELNPLKPRENLW